MNLSIENSIIERLHHLDDAHLYQVLDFIENINNQTKKSPRITGLFAHLTVNDAELTGAVKQGKLDHQHSFTQSLGNL